MAAQEQMVFLAQPHAEDPDWSLPLERARGRERALQRVRVERACSGSARAAEDGLVAAEGEVARGSPQ